MAFTKKLEAVIVEDDTTSIELMKSVIHEFIPNVEVKQTFDDPRAAASYLLKNPADLLFVDIEMPGFNGIELVKLLNPPKSTKVIFVTGHSEYAIDAIKLGAKDYVLKPITPGSLKEVVDKVALEFTHADEADTFSFDNRMLVRKLDRVSVIDIDTITYLEADGAYTMIYFDKDEPLRSSRALGIYKYGLEGNSKFIEITRSVILNIGFVTDVVRDGSRSYIVLSNGVRMDVSNRTAAGLVQAIENLMPKSF